MIPNIHNKDHFDSEFDLSNIPASHFSSFGSFYKVKRNSDFLDYTLLIMEFDLASYSNQILQEILAFIPFSKGNPYLLEIFTIYSWEQKINSQLFSQKHIVAVLLEKFDSVFSKEIEEYQNKIEKFSEEKALGLLRNCLGSLNYLIQECQLPYRELSPDLFFIKSKVMKFCELGTNHFNFKRENLYRPPELKVSRNNIINNLEKKYAYSLGIMFLELISKEKFDNQEIELFLKRTNNIDYEKIRPILIKMIDIESQRPKISFVLEEIMDIKQIEIKNDSNDIYLFPQCQFHQKTCSFICQAIKCNKLLCFSCIGEHSKFHQENIIEFKEFLKEKITEGGSIKIFEELLVKIKECSLAMGRQYNKYQEEILNIFAFLEKKTLKILENKKIAILDYFSSLKNDDFERLNIIEHQVKTHKVELQNLSQINEYKAPYLPDDIKRITPFLIEVVTNFNDKFSEKLKWIKQKSIENQYLVRQLEINYAPEINQVTKKINEIIDNLCVFDPILLDLEIEKLQTSFIDVKPTIIKENKQSINFLSNLEKGKSTLISASEDFLKMIDSKTRSVIFELQINSLNKQKITILEKQNKIFYFESENSSLNSLDYKTLDHSKNSIELKHPKHVCLTQLNDECLAIGDGNKILIYNLENYAIETVLTNKKNLNKITSIYTVNKSKNLVSLTEKSEIDIWDVSKKAIINSISLEDSFNNSSAITYELNDQPKIILGSQTGKMKVFDLNKLNCLHTLKFAHRDAIVALEISRHLKLLISAGKDKRLIIWDIDKFQAKKFINFYDDFNYNITSLGWQNSESILTAGEEKGDILIIDLEKELKAALDKLNPRRRSLLSKKSLELSQMMFFDDDKSTVNSKESRENLKDKLFLIDDCEENKEIFNHKRKNSLMLECENRSFAPELLKKYQDDSFCDKSKEDLYQLKEKRKSNLCKIF